MNHFDSSLCPTFRLPRFALKIRAAQIGLADGPVCSDFHLTEGMITALHPVGPLARFNLAPWDSRPHDSRSASDRHVSARYRADPSCPIFLPFSRYCLRGVDYGDSTGVSSGFAPVLHRVGRLLVIVSPIIDCNFRRTRRAETFRPEVLLCP